MAEPCQRFFVLVLSVGAGVVIRHRQPCGTATGDDGTAETVRVPRVGVTGLTWSW